METKSWEGIFFFFLLYLKTVFNIWFFRFLWGLESVDWSQKGALQILTPGESPWAGRWISLGRFLLPQMDNKKADLTGLLWRSYWQKTKKQKRSYWQTDMKHSGTDSGWALHFVYKMMTWKLLTGSKVIVARIKHMLVVPARPSWPNPSHLPFLHAPFHLFWDLGSRHTGLTSALPASPIHSHLLVSFQPVFSAWSSHERLSHLSGSSLLCHP